MSNNNPLENGLDMPTIARGVFEKTSEIIQAAENILNSDKKTRPSSIANINTMTSEKQLGALSRSINQDLENAKKLINNPLIGAFTLSDEKGNEKTLYIAFHIIENVDDLISRDRIREFFCNTNTKILNAKFKYKQQYMSVIRYMSFSRIPSKNTYNYEASFNPNTGRMHLQKHKAPSINIYDYRGSISSDTGSVFFESLKNYLNN
jgi:hypothetical protein